MAVKKQPKIKEIINLNETGEVICLTTSSGTFIAEGLASHNCARWKDIGGQIYADTSIVLKHIGKQAYSLWNVEVVSKPNDQAPQSQMSQQPQMPSINFTKAPNTFNPTSPVSPTIPFTPHLPSAGFNLNK